MKWYKNKTIWLGIFLLFLALGSAYGAKIVVDVKELYPDLWQPVVGIACVMSLTAWIWGIYTIGKGIKNGSKNKPNHQ